MTAGVYSLSFAPQVGFKLLAADVKIASRLVRRVLQGKNLSRYGIKDTHNIVYCLHWTHSERLRQVACMTQSFLPTSTIARQSL